MKNVMRALIVVSGTVFFCANAKTLQNCQPIFEIHFSMDHKAVFSSIQSCSISASRTRILKVQSMGMPSKEIETSEADWKNRHGRIQAYLNQARKQKPLETAHACEPRNLLTLKFGKALREVKHFCRTQDNRMPVPLVGLSSLVNHYLYVLKAR